jgi:hypothetical protein
MQKKRKERGKGQSMLYTSFHHVFVKLSVLFTRAFLSVGLHELRIVCPPYPISCVPHHNKPHTRGPPTYPSRQINLPFRHLAALCLLLLGRRRGYGLLAFHPLHIPLTLPLPPSFLHAFVACSRKTTSTVTPSYHYPLSLIPHHFSRGITLSMENPHSLTPLVRDCSSFVLFLHC